MAYLLHKYVPFKDFFDDHKCAEVKNNSSTCSLEKNLTAYSLSCQNSYISLNKNMDYLTEVEHQEHLCNLNDSNHYNECQSFVEKSCLQEIDSGKMLPVDLHSGNTTVMELNETLKNASTEINISENCRESNIDCLAQEKVCYKSVLVGENSELGLGV